MIVSLLSNRCWKSDGDFNITIVADTVSSGFVTHAPDADPSDHVEDTIDQIKDHQRNAEPVTKINGVNAVDYLSAFAAEQVSGLLEPNADWNQLFGSPAQELFGLNLLCEYAPFYAGDEMNITYRNGTSDSGPWLAFYQPDVFTGPLNNGGDFYNFYVLGLPPDHFDEAYTAYRASHPLTLPTLSVGSDENGKTASWHNDNSAYPDNPIMVQEGLGLLASGSATGYYLPGINTAVLSVPSFKFDGDGVGTFLEAIDHFVANATKREASTIIIDLQQNHGGLAVLAFALHSKVRQKLNRIKGEISSLAILAN